MIGILIVTHGKLAEGFSDSVNMIMGEQNQFHSIGLFPDSDLEHFKEHVLERMRELDSGEGTLVFVDLFGASPCNFAAANIMELIEEERKIRIITGVNLAMLIECLSMRTFSNDFDELYKNIIEIGKDGIKEVLDTIMLQQNND